MRSSLRDRRRVDPDRFAPDLNAAGVNASRESSRHAGWVGQPRDRKATGVGEEAPVRVDGEEENVAALHQLVRLIVFAVSSALPVGR